MCKDRVLSGRGTVVSIADDSTDWSMALIPSFKDLGSEYESFGAAGASGMV
jgi:hypothetical protein